MAFEVPGFKLTMVAGATSLETKQHTFVKQHTDGTAITGSAVTDKMIGILQNNPGIGGEAEVMVDGVSKVVAHAAIAIGDKISVHSDGTAITLAGGEVTQHVYGIALSACSNAGEIVSVLFSCMQHNLFT
jgi:hypothetical protein